MKRGRVERIDRRPTSCGSTVVRLGAASFVPARGDEGLALLLGSEQRGRLRLGVAPAEPAPLSHRLRALCFGPGGSLPSGPAETASPKHPLVGYFHLVGRGVPGDGVPAGHGRRLGLGLGLGLLGLGLLVIGGLLARLIGVRGFVPRR